MITSSVRAIPPLAWCFSLDQRGASVVCGSSVIVRPDGFFEGAWDSHTVDEWNFRSSPNVFGSGMVQTDEGWLAVPPSHTLECIYILAAEDGWQASNSLAFLIARTGARFETRGRSLLRSFVSIVNGIDLSPIAIPTDRGTLYLLYHHNAEIGPRLTVEPKPLPPRFPHFSSYKQYLSSVCSRVAANAADTSRPSPYKLLATVSTGYDLPACAAIAQTAGCAEAVTFKAARSGLSDDGTQIAEALGMSVVAFQRPNSTHGFQGQEAEFLCTGMQGEDCVYSVMSELLRTRLLVTGFAGSMWDRKRAPDQSPNLKRTDVSGCSLGEFRLSKNFVHLPLPFVGAQRTEDLCRISNSEELLRFSVGGTYDRPIARRIAEEAGVRRDMFGCKKKAVSLLIFANNSLMSSDTLMKIGARKMWSDPRMLSYQLTKVAATSGLRASNRLPEPFRRLIQTLIRRTMGGDYAVFEHTNPTMIRAQEWAIQEIATRYTAAISSSGHAREDGFA